MRIFNSWIKTTESFIHRSHNYKSSFTQGNIKKSQLLNKICQFIDRRTDVAYKLIDIKKEVTQY